MREDGRGAEGGGLRLPSASRSNETDRTGGRPPALLRCWLPLSRPLSLVRPLPPQRQWAPALGGKGSAPKSTCKFTLPSACSSSEEMGPGNEPDVLASVLLSHACGGVVLASPNATVHERFAGGDSCGERRVCCGHRPPPAAVAAAADAAAADDAAAAAAAVAACEAWFVDACSEAHCGSDGGDAHCGRPPCAG